MKTLQISPMLRSAPAATGRATALRREAAQAGDRNYAAVSRSSYFASFDIFQWMSAEAQEAFTLASRRRQFADGNRIYSQSEFGHEMYRIVSGAVRMSVLRRDGREALYLVLEPGDCFGTRSLLDEAPRSHTTSAKGEVELQVLRRESCDRLRAQHPSFTDGLMRVISRHVRLLSEFFASSALDELSCRVAQRLLKTHKVRVIHGHDIHLTIDLSQSEIASMVGASRQAVNRVLRVFQQQGIIQIERRGLSVLDLKRLQSVA
jgi:CRP-like cAMP-binding protein